MTDNIFPTLEEREAAERLCREATPGPFEAKPYKWYEDEWWRIENDRSDCIGAHMCKVDAALFAASRDLLPRLLAQVGALEAERDALLRRAEAAEYDVQSEADETCSACKHHGCEVSCQERVQYAVANDESCFQWRGPCTANTKGGPADDDA